MKKKLFFGVALMGIAFSGAAFTANRALQANHYIQKSGECKAITLTECIVNAQNNCVESDGGSMWPVYQNQTSQKLCNTKLFRPDKP